MMLSSLTIYMIVTWAAMTHTIYLVPEKQPLSTIIARVTPDVLPNTKIANLVSHLGKEEQLYGYVQMDSYPYISVDFQTGDVYTTTNTIKGCSSHDRCLFTFTVWVLHFKSSSHTEFRGQIELVFNAQASTTANIVEVVEYARDAQVIVSAKVNAELGKNATLSCTLQVDGFIHLTQSSWERQLPTGPVTVAVFNPVFGVHILPEYSQRLSYRSPLTYDATIVLGALALEDVGNYTCKMTTFPLGVLQASTTVSVLEASQGFQPAAPALYSIITASE